MTVSVCLDIEDEHVKLLAEALSESGRRRSPKDVAELAKKVARAGAQEALAYAAGIMVPTTISDMRYYRVYSLLSAGLTLEEAEELLPPLFKVPPATARTFIRNSVARFAADLGDAVKDAVQRSLQVTESDWDSGNGQWAVTVRSVIVHDWLFDQLHLAQIPVPNPKSAHRGAMWLVDRETLDYLRKLVDLGPASPPD